IHFVELYPEFGRDGIPAESRSILTGKMLRELFGRRFDFVTAGSKSVVDPAEQLRPLIRRKIGSAVERLLIRRQKDIERPSSLHAHGLHGVHVNLVYVRTFL